MIGARAFRETVRTVTVNYPVPFLVSLIFAGGVLLLGSYAASPLWPLAVGGLFCVFSATCLAAYAVFRRPDLLRSERHTVQQRLLTIFGDVDSTSAVRNAAGEMLTSTLRPTRSKDADDELGRLIKDEGERTDE